jgi:hypothetical protein
MLTVSLEFSKAPKYVYCSRKGCKNRGQQLKYEQMMTVKDSISGERQVICPTCVAYYNQRGATTRQTSTQGVL